MDLQLVVVGFGFGMLSTLIVIKATGQLRSQGSQSKTVYTNGITNWKTFVESCRTFFEANRGCPIFQLIESLDEIYVLAYRKAPFPKAGAEEADFFHMCFLICHRALLSAATSTGSGLPEDGPAITRRALEAAKVCLAVKADPSNFAQWKSVEVRKGRWESRRKGEKPKTFNPAYKGTPTEPLYEELQSAIGALSDFAVHFTPEHVLQYKWGQTSRSNGTTENSFGVDEDAVAKELLMMAGQRRLIIRVFDRCLDGKLLDQPQVRQVARRALDLYKDLLGREGFAEEAITAGESW